MCKLFMCSYLNFEFFSRGNYPKALTNYERGLVDSNNISSTTTHNPQHRNLCLAGIARMSIRCGDSRRGVNIAMDNESSRQLRKECAEILESMKVCKYYNRVNMFYKYYNWVITIAI